MTINCRFLRFVGKRWALRFLLLLLAVTPGAAQAIVFYAVPPNATVQRLSDAPTSLLAVTDAIPFGITSNQFVGLSTGSFFLIGSADFGSGKYGKINLNNYQNNNAWLADMTINGCGCTVPLGAYPILFAITGVQTAFQSMGLGAIVVMPVLDQIDTTGRLPANIVGFIVAEMVSIASVGPNWHATFELLSGPPSAPNVTATSSCGSITNMVFHETLPSGIANVLIRTWTATDSCGNSAIATQLVTVGVLSPSLFQINSVAAQGGDALLTWIMPQGYTGIVQATAGDVLGGYSSSFGDIGGPIFVPGNSFFTTNYLDIGAVTNFPARYYRIHLVVPGGPVP